MNLNQLKIFYFAAKRGNLSAAAQELYITQPAVTKGIQRLQEFYEMKFVDHIGKKLVLTDAGAVLYEQRKRGHIRILSSESFGDYYLPRIIIPFSKKHPLVRISMSILPTEQVVENTTALNSDLGFISYPIEHKKLVVKGVLEDQLMIIAPPEHPLTLKKVLEPQDLRDELMVMHETGSAPRRAIEDYIRRNNIPVIIPLEISSNRAIKRSVEEGIGIALISRKVAHEEIQAGKLAAIPLSDPSMKRKFYMVYHKDKYLSDTLRNFIDMVFEWAADYASSNYTN
ncbi:MAG: LysR family transcriptional regulator [Desulfobacterales bacterium]|jgi:DNA-binding transcriptional LysR family regulator